MMIAGPTLLAQWMERMKFESNRQLADYLGIHESTVTKLLNGTREIRALRFALAIEHKTGIPVEAWSEGSDGLVMAGARPRGKASRT